jgi:hypothetical protein
MNKILFFSINILFLIIFVRCSLTPKESNLEKYDDFITDVSKIYKSYSAKDFRILKIIK